MTPPPSSDSPSFPREDPEWHHNKTWREGKDDLGYLKRLKITQGEAGGTPALHKGWSAAATRGSLPPVDGGEQRMGEIVASMELENTADRSIANQGLRDKSTIRRTTVEGVVDTGAVMLVLPENVVTRLGLEMQREVVVTYADDRKETRPVAGPVTVRIGNRFMNTDCIVGQPLSEPLIGQIVLEALDLVADCTNRTVGPRPESPDSPLLKLK